jgi:hypothetical protein
MPSSDKVRATFASLAIVAFAFLLFHPAIIGGKILAPLDITTTMFAPWNEDANGAKPHNHNPTDAVTQYLPYRIFAEKSLREDGYIGWNPYEMGGYSLAGNTMALPGSWPIQLHRYLAFKDAWNFGIIAEFLIAGFGMLMFLRSRKLPWLPCLIGAIAFMANSQFIIWIYHRWALGAFCWMPWILWASAGISSFRYLNTRQLSLPLFLALAMTGASLQHIIFIFLACVCIFLAQVREFRKPLQEFPRVALWASAFLLATAMAAFTLVPQIQGYLTNISIGHTRGGIGYAEGAAQPLFNLIAIFAQIWPWLVGDPQTIDGWRLLKSGYTDQAFLGTIPMLLAICGMFNRNMPKAAKWLIALGLLLPLTPLVGPLYHRVQLLFLLGGSWMSAEMLASLTSQISTRWHKFAIAAVACVGIALLCGTLLPASVRIAVEDKVVEKSLVASSDSQFGSDKAWIESRARAWVDRFALHNPRTAWVYCLLILGTTGLILAVRSRNPSGVQWGRIAILGATSLELLTMFQTWTTYSSPEDLQRPNELLTKVKEAAGDHRVLQGLGPIPFAKILAPPNMLAAAGIPAIDAYESIQYPTVFQSLSSLPRETQYDLAGVGASVQRNDVTILEGTEHWLLVGQNNGFDIRRNPNVPPEILVGSGNPPANPEELPIFLRSGITVSPAHRTMNRLTFPLPKETSWLRIAKNYHIGWKWKCESGSWQPFQRGPDNACWITSGLNTGGQIDVKFFPRPFWLFLFSALAGLAWFTIIIFVYMRSAQASPQPTHPS